MNRRVFLGSALAIPGSLALANPKPRFDFFQPIQPARPLQVMAHRGLACRAPENTRPAIESCIFDFIEWVEVDVRLSRDGQHVLFHDDKLDGKSSGKGPVAEVNLEQFRKLEGGEWFAERYKGTDLLSLRETLDIAKGKCNLYLDCKKINVKLLVEDIRRAKMEQQVIVYDSTAIISEVRRLSQGMIPTMTKYRPAINLEKFIREVAPQAVEIDADDVTPELCKRFHIEGIFVQAKVLGAKWDNPTMWLKMISAGVDWLQTDDPAGVLMTAGRQRHPRWPVQVAYHRGANRYAPENTLPAIRKAVELGADFIEIDIRTTKDNHLVLMHDSTVNRTTNGQGRVRDLTLAEIEKLDAGAWFGKPFIGTKVPTLDEALKILGGKCAVYLDAKDIAPELILAAVKKHDLFDRHVVYQSAEYAAQLLKLDARLRPLPPLRSAADLPRLAALKPYGVDANWRALSAELIKDCHAQGIKVFSDALGLNETLEQYRSAISWGIDLIQTDFPLRVLRAVELEAATRR